MAFTTKHVSGVLGEFKPVIDIAGGTLTTKQVSGVLGEFKPVLDIAQAPAAGGVIKTVNGLAIASIKTIKGTVVASVKTINGTAYQ